MTANDTWLQSKVSLRDLFLVFAAGSFISGCILFSVVNEAPRDQGFQAVVHGHGRLPSDSLRLTRKPLFLKIVFFVDRFNDEVDRMNKGGAGGELRLFRSMMDAVASIPGIQMDVITTSNQLCEKLLRSADLIVSDQYRLTSLLSIVPDALTDPTMKCKLRFIDFWGTPPEQNSINLNPKQFLVPYPNPWNEFLGFRQDPIAPTPGTFRPDRPIVLLHGKLGRYFQDHLGLIEELTQSYIVTATVPASQLDGLRFPSNVINVGICNASQWEKLLAKSSVVIGFGDPVLAPTALESTAAGSPYIFAKYAQPRSLTDLPAHPISSQHDFMLSIGSPYAYAVDVSDIDGVLDIVKIAIRKTFRPWIPTPYREEQYAERIRDIISTNLCLDAPESA